MWILMIHSLERLNGEFDFVSFGACVYGDVMRGVLHVETENNLDIPDSLDSSLAHSPVGAGAGVCSN